ncbi:MAG: cupredoxin domain-containing protein [Saccharospirillum sp.]
MVGNKSPLQGLLCVVVWSLGWPVWAVELPEFVLTDNQGEPLADAVLVVKAAGTSAGAPGGAVVDQSNLAFVPEVTVVQAGTRVRFPNSDDTRHHVYSFSDAKTFELQLYRSDDAPRWSLIAPAWWCWAATSTTACVALSMWSIPRSMA